MNVTKKQSTHIADCCRFAGYIKYRHLGLLFFVFKKIEYSSFYNRIKNWTVSDLREWILSYSTTEAQIRDMSHALTSEMVAKAATQLKKMNAPTFDGKYVCILHPSVAFDLRQDEAWIAAHQYAAATELFSGEIGELHGVRFVETTEAKIFRGEDLAQNGRTLLVNGKVENNAVVAFDGGTVAAGALAGRYVLLGGERRRVVSNTGSSMTLDSAVTAADNAVIYPGEGGAEGCAVYGCLFVGKGAYGVVDLNDGTEVIVKPRGSSGTADPLDQRSSVGWKGVHAAAILYDEYIVRVECGSSYSGQDKAN